MGHQNQWQAGKKAGKKRFPGLDLHHGDGHPDWSAPGRPSVGRDGQRVCGFDPQMSGVGPARTDFAG